MAKYLKPDSDLGYVEDSVEIEYLKFNNLRHSVLGFMFGDFNEQGVYVVSPEIVSELISMRKFIVDSLDNIEVCHSELKFDKPITFLVTFEGNKATLSLLEQVKFEGNYKINSGAFSNVNEYVLDEVETAGEIDRNLIYRRWNISEFGGAVLDIANMDEVTLAKYFGLVNRYKYLMLANTSLLDSEEEIEEVEAEYAFNMMQYLKAYPKLNEAVVNRLKATVKEKKGTIQQEKPNFIKTINEVLDDAVEENISVLTKEEKASFEQDKHNLRLNHNQKIQQIVEIHHDETQTKLADDVTLNEPASHTIITMATDPKLLELPLTEIKDAFKTKQKELEDRLVSTPVEVKGQQPAASKDYTEASFRSQFLDLLETYGIAYGQTKNADNTATTTTPAVAPATEEKSTAPKKREEVSWFRKIPDPKPAKAPKPGKDKGKKATSGSPVVGYNGSTNYVSKLTNDIQTNGRRERNFNTNPAPTADEPKRDRTKITGADEFSLSNLRVSKKSVDAITRAEARTPTPARERLVNTQNEPDVLTQEEEDLTIPPM